MLPARRRPHWTVAHRRRHHRLSPPAAHARPAFAERTFVGRNGYRFWFAFGAEHSCASALLRGRCGRSSSAGSSARVAARRRQTGPTTPPRALGLVGRRRRAARSRARLAELRLRRGALHHGTASLDPLFGADFSAGCGVHARIYPSAGITGRTRASAALSRYNAARPTGAAQFDL